MRSAVFLTAMMAAAVSATPVLKIIEDVHTVYSTVTAGTPQATQHVETPAKAPQPQANTGSGFIEKPQPVAQPKPVTSTPSTGSSGSDQMLAVANKYRALYNLPLFSWDASMIDNCQEAGGNGRDEVHKMIPGTAMGQVLTPGQNQVYGDSEGLSAFELAYAAWMCESSTDSQLQQLGCCPIVQRVTTMEYTDKGHYEILTNPDYTKIACAFTPNSNGYNPDTMFQGIWACDCAP